MTEIQIQAKAKGLEYFSKLQSFYSNLMSHAATKEEQGHILTSTRELIQYTAKKIEERKEEKAVDERQTFNLEFIEFLKEIEVVVRRLNLEVLRFNSLKLKVLVEEMGSMLDYKEHTSFVQKLKNLRSQEIVRLLTKTFKGVFVTFSLAVLTNILLSYFGILALFETQIGVLGGVETGMAALIVFITSFNLSYTNSKRGKTSTELIVFTSSLNIYARRIKFIIQQEEPDIAVRRKRFEDINYYFNCIGLKLIEGVDPKHNHNLKFDVTILQCLDLINDQITGYVKNMEEVSKIRTRTIQDEIIKSLNDFQITATVRTPKVLSSMNDWLIKVTYFVLVAISPFSILPRLLVLNIFQRAFFNVASEVDNAIYSTSIAAIPVENRVVRRLCRISSILNED